MQEQLTNARTAAELTKIPVEHLLCANTIYHTLALMNPENVLRPSHFGMLEESVGSLRDLVMGPEEDDNDDDDGDGFPLPGDYEEINKKELDTAPADPSMGEKILSTMRSIFPVRSTRE